MKINFKTIGLFAILVFAPMVSWYYLSTGMDYRKRLMKETSPKGHISSFYSCDDTFIPKTTIIDFGGIDNNIKTELNEQFKDSYSFIFVDSKDECFITNDTLGQPKMMLLDTLQQVRGIYENYDRASIKLLVEHLSAVIPQETQKR